MGTKRYKINNVELSIILREFFGHRVGENCKADIKISNYKNGMTFLFLFNDNIEIEVDFENIKWNKKFLLK